MRILINEAIDKAASTAAMRRFLKIFPDQERMDHRIIGACLALEGKRDRVRPSWLT